VLARKHPTADVDHRYGRGNFVLIGVPILVVLNALLAVILVGALPPSGAPLSAQDSAKVSCRISNAFVPPAVLVRFELNASGGEKPYVYSWSFGDGSSNASSVPYVVHPYQSFGEFKVTGVVYDALQHHAIANPIYVNASLATC